MFRVVVDGSNVRVDAPVKRDLPELLRVTALPLTRGHARELPALAELAARLPLPLLVMIFGGPVRDADAEWGDGAAAGDGPGTNIRYDDPGRFADYGDVAQW